MKSRRVNVYSQPVLKWLLPDSEGLAELAASFLLQFMGGPLIGCSMSKVSPRLRGDLHALGSARRASFDVEGIEKEGTASVSGVRVFQVIEAARWRPVEQHRGSEASCSYSQANVNRQPQQGRFKPEKP
jgi:hypothetical protein